jgi:putative PIN family toxin of toxin-antitoxin system
MKKIKRFVLDTNALISAFLTHKNSVSAQAYIKAKTEGKILFSEATFNEFTDVYVRPKFDRYISLEKRLVTLDDLAGFIELTNVSVTIKACRDPKDDKYLELAIQTDATCIITGDKDLLVLHPFRGIPILSPADFLAQF